MQYFQSNHRITGGCIACFFVEINMEFSLGPDP